MKIQKGQLLIKKIKIEMIKNSQIVNTEENDSENKRNKEYDDITSINITDSKKVIIMKVAQKRRIQNS